MSASSLEEGPAACQSLAAAITRSARLRSSRRSAIQAASSCQWRRTASWETSTVGFGARSVGHEQSLIDQTIDQRKGLLWQLPAQRHPTLRCGRRIIDSDQRWHKAALREGIQGRRATRQTWYLHGLCEGCFHGLANRAAYALHLVHIFVPSDPSSSFVVRDEPLKRERKQRQASAPSEVLDQQFDKICIDRDTRARKPRRPFDDLLERRR